MDDHAEANIRLLGVNQWASHEIIGKHLIQINKVEKQKEQLDTP